MNEANWAGVYTPLSSKFRPGTTPRGAAPRGSWGPRYDLRDVLAARVELLVDRDVKPENITVRRSRPRERASERQAVPSRTRRRLRTWER